jgi:hypothetical protein
MALYNVSITNKHDIWLKEDEEDPCNWTVMSKEQLEYCLQRNIKSHEVNKGRDIIGYNDIIWNKFI